MHKILLPNKAKQSSVDAILTFTWIAFWKELQLNEWCEVKSLGFTIEFICMVNGKRVDRSFPFNISGTTTCNTSWIEKMEENLRIRGQFVVLNIQMLTISGNSNKSATLNCGLQQFFIFMDDAVCVCVYVCVSVCGCKPFQFYTFLLRIKFLVCKLCIIDGKVWW